MSLAKVGLVGAVSAAGLTGTYFLVYSGSSVPEAKTLSGLSDYQTKYSGKIGAQYSHFLAAAEAKKNEAWWK